MPDFFIGKNVVHLPTVKCHIYTTTTGAMKNAFGGLLNTRRHYTHTWIHETLVDLLAIQQEIHPRHLRRHGRHPLRQRPGPAHDDPGAGRPHAGERRPGGDRRRRRQADGLRSAVHPATSGWRTSAGSASATRARSASSGDDVERRRPALHRRPQPRRAAAVICSGSGRCSACSTSSSTRRSSTCSSWPRGSTTTTSGGRRPARRIQETVRRNTAGAGCSTACRDDEGAMTRKHDEPTGASADGRTARRRRTSLPDAPAPDDSSDAAAASGSLDMTAPVLPVASATRRRADAAARSA